MRLFSLFSFASILAIYVNAAALDKRDISAPVALCISDISTLEGQFTALKTIFDGFTVSSGYVGFLSIHTKAQTIVSQLRKAQTECCVVSTVLSTEEKDGILTALSSLVPDVQDTMDSFVAKKPIFKSIPTGFTLIKDDIPAMHTEHTPLNTCLSSVVPPISIPEVGDLIDQIEAAYELAELDSTNPPITV